MYYLNLSDEEVQEKIKQLTPIQQKKYAEVLMIIGDDFRRALFIASSYPLDLEK